MRSDLRVKPGPACHFRPRSLLSASGRPTQDQFFRSADIRNRRCRRPAPYLQGDSFAMHFAVVITLSAFLIFLVQPLIAKQILPWFGGSAAVWTTCMVFFQTALLAGYAYADWAPRRFGVAKHAKIHAVLVTLSLIALPITVSAFWKPADGAAPIPQILALLAATIGLPYVVLSATSPLVQIWFSRTHPLRDPYRLFALSNTASLVALLCYPFLVEPRLVLRDQAWGWSILYALFVLLMVALAVRVSRRSDAPPRGSMRRRSPSGPRRRRCGRDAPSYGGWCLPPPRRHCCSASPITSPRTSPASRCSG
ncbi:MAG: hypothetical protein IPM02_09435 [Betaproteobacteria bacterium]|nr:hypothetical protein [Betaproteobacteria bacterium]